ncbi:MAG: PIN domain-containing protein [Chloroflexota bacterium]
MALALIDTNILVYAVDPNSEEKQQRAIDLLERLEAVGSGRLSVQCLAEFFSAATRKLQPPLTTAEAAAQLESLAQAFPVFDLTPMIVLEAARGARDRSLSYYDAQLWASARLNQIPLIFSEDFDNGSVIEGVRFVNPFADEFRLETWA